MRQSTTYSDFGLVCDAVVQTFPCTVSTQRRPGVGWHDNLTGPVMKVTQVSDLSMMQLSVAHQAACNVLAALDCAKSLQMDLLLAMSGSGVSSSNSCTVVTSGL